MVIDSSQLPGQTLGTCAIQRLIGRGGMGAVYLAQQVRPRREVAVKVFMPALLLDNEQRAEFLRRFRREADAIAALDHVNIVPLYDTLPDLIGYLRGEGVGELYLPERLEVVESMPRTATGKIRKVELRQRYGGDNTGPGASFSTD